MDPDLRKIINHYKWKCKCLGFHLLGEKGSMRETRNGLLEKRSLGGRMSVESRKFH
jgi:hypothetical protein